MCYICKLRLAKLLEKGYIFDAQIAEVTQEVKQEFDAMMENAYKALTDIEAGAALATLMQGMKIDPQDYLKTTTGTKTNFGVSDDLLDQVLKNYDPKKAN